MYSTLEMMKRGQACTGGYGRQIAFFGTKLALKTQHIPLHAIALIGGKEDINWTIENAMYVDPAEYMVFQKRTIQGVWGRLCQRFIENSLSGFDNIKNKHLKPIAMEALAVAEYDGIMAFLERHRFSNFKHNMFSEVIHNACWTSPAAYMGVVIESLDNTVYSDSNMGKAILAEREARAKLKAQAMEKDVALAVTAEPSLIETLQNESDEDDVEATVTISTMAPGRSARSARDDDDDEEEEERESDWNEDDDDEDEAPRRGRAIPAKKAKSHRVNVHVHEFYTTRLPEGQNIARAFSEDPYDFMAKLSYKVPKGVSINRVKEGEKRVLSINLTDERDMFAILKLLNSRAGIPDQL